MDNAQKAIMIGVGLFITIIVIAAVMLITGVGQDLLNQGTSQLSGISESLRTQMVDQYDGKRLTGSQVKSALADLINRSDTSVQVGINKSQKTTYKSSDVTSNTQKYTGQVIYNSNTGIIMVNFYTSDSGKLADTDTSWAGSKSDAP